MVLAPQHHGVASQQCSIAIQLPWHRRVVPLVPWLLLCSSVLQVDSLIQELLEPDISLEEEASRNWGEIVSQQYKFDRLEAEVSAPSHPNRCTSYVNRFYAPSTSGAGAEVCLSKGSL